MKISKGVIKIFIQNNAKEYLQLGLSVLPTKADKKPNIGSWKHLQKKRLTEEEAERLFLNEHTEGIGIITGTISGSLEVIDIDCKYDLTGKLWEDYSSLLKDNLYETYDRLVIAKTKSGGYHIYYRCPTIEGNLKLANRPITEKEKEEKYLEVIQEGLTEEQAKKKIKGFKELVLIETRGEGGYVIAPDTEGYRFIQGSAKEIPTIDKEERDIILSIARTFNQVEEPQPQKKAEQIGNLRAKYSGKTSLEDYDERGDTVGLLLEEGWDIAKTTAERIFLRRPFATTEYSGNYLLSKRCLMIFSRSTEFQAGKPYSPSEVYCLLRCGGDWKRTALELGKEGYGDYQPSKQDKQSKQAPPHEAESLISIDYQEEGIVITSPGAEARDEIIKAIAEIKQQTKERIYVLEGEYKRREYIYQLSDIFKRYGALQEELGELRDEDIDRFLDEVITGSINLEPIDKDIYLKRFLDSEGVKELGISKEALEITVDRLKTTKEKERQDSQLKKLLSEAKSLQDKGETAEALDLLRHRAKDISLTVKATEFSKLFTPVTEEELKKRQAEKPEDLDSGLRILQEPLFIPSGAITIVTAPTSHGKTAFLSNIAVNVTSKYPDKDFYFFTYEEDSDTVLMNTLNTYLDKRLSHNNRKTLKNYFSTDSTDYIKAESKEFFLGAKDKFFSELIYTGRLNIQYTPHYDIDTLCDAIRYLKKHGKPGGIFIDYIQQINLPQGKYKTYSRQEEVKVICVSLKDVAVETGLPLILASQFNREVTNLLQIHPTKISEAGDIERIANTILGLYNNTFEPKGTENELKEIKNRNYPTDSIYVKVLKRRGGVPGVEDCWKWNGNQNKIKNRASSEGSDNRNKAQKEEPYFN